MVVKIFPCTLVANQGITSEVRLIIPDFTCSAVHVTDSFLALFSLLSFLFLFLGISSCHIDAKKIKREAKERERGRKRDKYMNCRTQKLQNPGLVDSSHIAIGLFFPDSWRVIVYNCREDDQKVLIISIARQNMRP